MSQELAIPRYDPLAPPYAPDSAFLDSDGRHARIEKIIDARSNRPTGQELLALREQAHTPLNISLLDQQLAYRETHTPRLPQIEGLRRGPHQTFTVSRIEAIQSTIDPIGGRSTPLPADQLRTTLSAEEERDLFERKQRSADARFIIEKEAREKRDRELALRDQEFVAAQAKIKNLEAENQALKTRTALSAQELKAMRASNDELNQKLNQQATEVIARRTAQRQSDEAAALAIVEKDKVVTALQVEKDITADLRNKWSSAETAKEQLIEERKKQDSELAQQTEAAKQAAARITQLEEDSKKLQGNITQLGMDNGKKDEAITEKDGLIAQQTTQLQDKEEEIVRLKQETSTLRAVIKEPTQKLTQEAQTVIESLAGDNEELKEELFIEFEDGNISQEDLNLILEHIDELRSLHPYGALDTVLADTFLEDKTLIEQSEVIEAYALTVSISSIRAQRLAAQMLKILEYKNIPFTNDLLKQSEFEKLLHFVDKLNSGK